MNRWCGNSSSASGFPAGFGEDAKIGWNPDSFGYNWQLPQIYKKSGVDYLVTQKMAWNDTTNCRSRFSGGNRPMAARSSPISRRITPTEILTPLAYRRT